jgi:hypothetical protein
MYRNLEYPQWQNILVSAILEFDATRQIEKLQQPKKRSEVESENLPFPLATNTNIDCFPMDVQYKNVSGREISSGHLSVSISLYEPGPINAKTTHGEQDLEFTSRLRVGEVKTLKQKVLTGGTPPSAWVREITYTDGSRWTAIDAGQCQYSPRPIQTGAGPIIPPL